VPANALTMSLGPDLSAWPAEPPVPMSIPHIMRQHFAAANQIASVTSSKNLIDHGGPVVSSPNIYVIYWGNPSEFPSDLEDGLNNFFEGFGNSGYSNILTQYFRGAPPPTTTLAGTASDHSEPPESAPSVKQITREACKFTGGTVDPNGIYVTVTTNFPVGAYYCAWHAFGKCNGSRIPVVYLPNADDDFGCGVSSAKQNPYSNATQAIANDAAHELAESMTDPLINAWYDSHGNEVADKCQTSYGPTVRFSNGTIWRVQELWSNANGKCKQSIPLP